MRVAKWILLSFVLIGGLACYALYFMVATNWYRTPFPFSIPGFGATFLAVIAVGSIYGISRSESGKYNTVLLCSVLAAFTLGTAFPFISDVRTWTHACEKLLKQYVLFEYPKKTIQKGRISIAIPRVANEDQRSQFQRLLRKHPNRISHIYGQQPNKRDAALRYDFGPADDSCVRGRVRQPAHTTENNTPTYYCLRGQSAARAQPDLIVLADRRALRERVDVLTVRAIRGHDLSTIYSTAVAVQSAPGYWLPFSLRYPQICAPPDLRLPRSKHIPLWALTAHVVETVLSEYTE